MRVLGLDLSIRATGIAGPHGTHSTYTPRSEGDRRLLDITRAVTSLCLAHDAPAVDLVVLEGPYATKNTSGLVLVGLNYTVRCALIDHHIPYLIVPPSTLKVYATGTGRGTKADMRMELYKRTQTVDVDGTRHDGLDVADDNQVDAIWLRALGLDLAGAPALPLPQTHRRALDKLTLPEGARP